MAAFQIGDVVSFHYPASHRKGTVAHDPNPLVLILHNGYRSRGDSKILVHGLNLNLLTQHEIDFLKAVVNINFAEEISKKDAAIRTQLQRMEHLSETLDITKPHDFYVRFVSGFIRPRGYEPYRKYDPAKITGSKVVAKYEVISGGQKQNAFSKFYNRVKYHKGVRL